MKNLLFIVIMLISLISCETNKAQSTSILQTLSTADYQTKMTEIKNFQLIDVRTQGEYVEEHLLNSVNMDYNSKDFEAQLNTLDKSKPTFIYCLSGGRSGSAMNTLSKLGFKEVYNMKGGILQWKGDNFKVTAANDAPVWKGMTKNDYLNSISDEKNTLVDFKASWCAPCKKLLPMLQALEKEYAGQFTLLPIDIDENKSLAEDMRIVNIPYLIYYKNGKEALKIDGIKEKKEIIVLLGLKK